MQLQTITGTGFHGNTALNNAGTPDANVYLTLFDKIYSEDQLETFIDDELETLTWLTSNVNGVSKIVGFEICGAHDPNTEYQYLDTICDTLPWDRDEVKAAIAYAGSLV